MVATTVTAPEFAPGMTVRRRHGFPPNDWRTVEHVSPVFFSLGVPSVRVWFVGSDEYGHPVSCDTEWEVHQ